MSETTGLRTVTFEAGGVHGVVRAPVGMDAIDVYIITGGLKFDRTSRIHVERALKFAYTVLQTVEVSGLDFEWATADSEPGALSAAFAGWQGLPRAVIAAWHGALFEAELAPNAGE